MAQLTSSAVHIDAPLTNLTIAYVQDAAGFIADKVFPRVPVDKKTNKFYIYNRADFNRIGQVQARAPRTKAPRVGMSLSTDTYSAEIYALSTDFDYETLANEDTALNIRAAGAQMLTTQLLIDREIKWQPNTSRLRFGERIGLVCRVLRRPTKFVSGRITLTRPRSKTLPR